MNISSFCFDQVQPAQSPCHFRDRCVLRRHCTHEIVESEVLGTSSMSPVDVTPLVSLLPCMVRLTISLLGGKRRWVPRGPRNLHGKYHQEGTRKGGVEQISKLMIRNLCQEVAQPGQSLACSNEDEALPYLSLIVPLSLRFINSLPFSVMHLLASCHSTKSIVRKSSDCLVEVPSEYPLNS